MAKAKAKKRARFAYSLKSQHISDQCWYYEDRKGLDLHIWMQPDRALSKGEQYHVNINIPWRLIRGTAKRMKRRSAGSET